MKIIDKVHKIAFGHASTVYPTLKFYLADIISATKKSKNILILFCNIARIAIGLQSLAKYYWDLWIGHLTRLYVLIFFLGISRLCHIMGATTIYSVGAVVPVTSMELAIELLDSHWIFQFWTPTVIQFDRTFANDIFCQCLDTNGTNTCSLE